MLNAISRKPKSELNSSRREGKIPAIVYGRGFDSVPVLIDQKEFATVIKQHGRGSLLDFKIKDQEPFKVLIQEFQKHPIKDAIRHIDFYRIRMDEKLKTDIELSFVGEPGGVKAGGVLVKNVSALSIECLPGDLVSSIEVDLSALADIHSTIKLKEITLPKGITVLGDPEQIVTSIAEAAEEEEVYSSEEEEAKIAELGKEGEEGEGEKEKEGEEAKEGDEKAQSDDNAQKEGADAGNK